ncbi:MAE_28990/MAE_18760 family HEPN-like nuclease [Paenibacillus sp. IHBB 10380]|uniref:MAE_28990/MAE_18760 family HEPN-like nuclease n=1 Tax=Paenibacillus sp. IHBB 10380 TaxID=1566358 RepID=UPI0005CFABB1|nr:MAE_28990/MAE_18760 family HEPN-like nuclease [Paenibacillus sp. IHBB 10380]AJS58985.1 hypothetical protein UB51_11465 [Paenibacillus sp. IHBB 10380]
MDILESELLQELTLEEQWRIDEISMIKTIPHLYRMTGEHRQVLKKYLIPALYALWEGFVVKSFELYTKKLNELNLNINQIHPSILTHDLDIKQGLKDGRVNGNKQIQFTLELKNYFTTNIIISGKIPTKSNVKFNTINSILERFNLDRFPKSEFEYRLNKLLKYRNDIAHGENSLSVDDELVLELSDTVIVCMDKLSDTMVDGFIKKRYLNEELEEKTS